MKGHFGLNDFSIYNKKSRKTKLAQQIVSLVSVKSVKNSGLLTNRIEAFCTLGQLFKMSVNAFLDLKKIVFLMYLKW